ncbi:MAG: hypothetical protein KDC67_10020, partial [Ignavibacteriae bacterium]|nr:hypothetical protein [Ignavibacteriota bacterium]
MRVYEVLPKLRANSRTYYNLSPKQIIMFKDVYSYLKRHKEKEIRKNVFQYNDALSGQINYWLNNNNELDYIRKYKAMELIAHNLIHE